MCVIKKKRTGRRRINIARLERVIDGPRVFFTSMTVSLLPSSSCPRHPKAELTPEPLLRLLENDDPRSGDQSFEGEWPEPVW